MAIIVVIVQFMFRLSWSLKFTYNTLQVRDPEDPDLELSRMPSIWELGFMVPENSMQRFQRFHPAMTAQGTAFHANHMGEEVIYIHW